MKTITAKTKAWATDHSPPPADTLAEAKGALVHHLAFSMNDMKSVGWTLIGEAEITVTVVDTDSVVKNRIETLNAQIRRTQADAELKINQFKAEISKLEAITYEPEAA